MTVTGHGESWPPGGDGPLDVAEKRVLRAETRLSYGHGRWEEHLEWCADCTWSTMSRYAAPGCAAGQRLRADLENACEAAAEARELAAIQRHGQVSGSSPCVACGAVFSAHTMRMALRCAAALELAGVR